MPKALYVDKTLLAEKIENSGLKVNFIIEKLGLSPNGYYKKINGKTPFKVPEVFVLCKLLSISDEDSIKIFYPNSNLEVDRSNNNE